jgi:UPF0716 family protein affecting phage T7 exclusion
MVPAWHDSVVTPAVALLWLLLHCAARLAAAVLLCLVPGVVKTAVALLWLFLHCAAQLAAAVVLCLAPGVVTTAGTPVALI